MKTIYQAAGMKIILIAVITIIGISLFSAFKQSEGSKKYLTMTLYLDEINIINENEQLSTVKLSQPFWRTESIKKTTEEINSISSKGYKLIATQTLYAPNVVQYIFEKE
jgi:hypothetical protein